MRGIIKTILGILLIYLIFLNFDKVLAIGNAIIDKTYNILAAPIEKTDTINQKTN